MAKLGSEKQKALTHLYVARRSLIRCERALERAMVDAELARDLYADMLQEVEDLIPEEPSDDEIESHLL